MKYVKWIFVVLLICSLTSFVEKNKPTGGLMVGDRAPSFEIKTSEEQPTMELSHLKGKYVLLSFWASYDASSRVSNVSLNHAIRTASSENIEMVSVSFDKYASIFDETIRKDQIAGSAACFVETRGENSQIFKKYRLNKGFSNYLLDQNGVIIAKNISAADLSAYLN
ncbi:MAG: redoxin domain-containing protein [Bacteroides sp.]|nr:redoxin domain-containing protein [Bacteroides sp.]